MGRLTARFATSHAADPVEAAAEIRAGVDQPGLAVVFLFCTARYDLARLGPALAAFPCPVVACTSAGQIGPEGYQRGGITAAGLASVDLTAHPFLIAPLAECRERAAEAAPRIQALLDRLPPGRRAFGVLLCDGLSCAEEGLVAALYQSLGDLPIVGGSAGDDLAFERTSVYWEGAFVPDAAVLTVLETSLPFAPFRFHHFHPTERKLVTTAAEPTSRVVKEINGYPAAEAYAELLGVQVSELTPSMMSAHPLMLRLGDDQYLRSVSKVNPDGSLTLFCAIDEGLVLSIGDGEDPIAALERGFGAVLRQVPRPEVVIGFDCILRRLELEEKGLDARVGALLASQRVIGFSTYGEQCDAVHVNQTFTGVALGA